MLGRNTKGLASWDRRRGSLERRDLLAVDREHYQGGGVAVLGINLRNASGLFVEYEIAYRQLKSLGDGMQCLEGSPWAYRSVRSAAAVLKSQAAEGPSMRMIGEHSP